MVCMIFIVHTIAGDQPLLKMCWLDAYDAHLVHASASSRLGSVCSGLSSNTSRSMPLARNRTSRSLGDTITINVMVDQLNSFAAEVTRVAREVGIKGRSAAKPMSGACRAPGKT